MRSATRTAARARERRPRRRAALGELQQQRVEALVELDVALEGVDCRPVGPDQRVDLRDASLHRLELAGVTERSAASRAAVPSSTPRRSIASSTSLARERPNDEAAAGAGSSSPSCSSLASASRRGVRETPSCSASGISATRSPPRSSPSRISSRSSVARSVWERLAHRTPTARRPPPWPRPSRAPVPLGLGGGRGLAIALVVVLLGDHACRSGAAPTSPRRRC